MAANAGLRYVVVVLLPAMAGLHSGSFPWKISVIVGFYSYFGVEQSGIIYHPFLQNMYFGRERGRRGKLLLT